ncbi:MAG TPA: DUF1501 domain-containing protein [Thermoanaerobaculia bacterium]|nr:DUF1501 domain-containing protein [Thermoanaerobaculia bacterium]
MKKNSTCTCTGDGSSLFSGDGFSRRHFIRIGGTALVASWFADVFAPPILHGATSAGPSLHNTARSCIFVFLSGGPSHVDMWDLKEGSWTPSDFAPTSYGAVRWPHGLLPKTAEHLGKLALIRSGMAWAAVHPLAQKWAQISRNPSGATGGFAPHIGAVVSLETQLRRTPNEVLPGFVALGGTMAGAGYLSARHAPFAISASQDGLPALSHPDGAQRLEERWALLQKIDTARVSGALGRDAADMASFYDQAKVLIDTPGINQIFSFTAEERERYGATTFGDSLVVARNLVASNRGTRFVHVTLGGWDHHDNIYNREANNSLYTRCRPLDDGLGALLGDLAATPGTEPGRMLLDETLVVILGEFGRTTGPLRGTGDAGGRDHYLRMSLVMAGGGVRGGRVIGMTDAVGDRAVEYGWSAGRDVRPEDITATIYSALGIDYTTVRPDDPLGRGFEYVPYAKEGLYQPVDELF